MSGAVLSHVLEYPRRYSSRRVGEKNLARISRVKDEQPENSERAEVEPGVISRTNREYSANYLKRWLNGQWEIQDMEKE
jgi:hypothetical protein